MEQTPKVYINIISQYLKLSSYLFVSNESNADFSAVLLKNWCLHIIVFSLSECIKWLECSCLGIVSDSWPYVIWHLDCIIRGFTLILFLRKEEWIGKLIRIFFLAVRKYKAKLVFKLLACSSMMADDLKKEIDNSGWFW